LAGIGGPILGGAYIGDGEGETEFLRGWGRGEGVLYVRPCPGLFPPYPCRPRL
jgi:hypothetical protein